jgi:hypothetical protein
MNEYSYCRRRSVGRDGVLRRLPPVWQALVISVWAVLPVAASSNAVGFAAGPGAVLDELSSIAVNPPVQCPAPRVTGANPWPAPSATPLPVVAPVIPDLPVPTATHAADFLTAYTRALRFNLVYWFPTCYGGQTGPVNPGGTNEPAIRTPAMVASAVGLALASKGYNPTAVGMSRYVAAQRVRHIAVGLCMHHKVNAGSTGWGRSVQSAYWAFHAG